MKKILIPLFLLISFFEAKAQFNPSAHIVINDALGQNQSAPIEGRGMFWDAANFKWRDFQSTAEVLSTLPTNANRFSHFPIWVHVGGTLSGGVWTGGISVAYFFKDGLANGNLVRWYTDSTASSGGTIDSIAATSSGGYNWTVTNPKGPTTNLGLSLTFGGDITGPVNNISVQRFNGQLPSFYLNYLNLTNTPAIPAQLNLSTLGLVSQSGSYPNITLTGQTPTFEQTLLKLNTTSQLDSINIGSFIFRISGTSALGLPGGNTAQRPSSPSYGDTRINTDSVSSPIETWNNTAWVHPSGGGGGGGSGITQITGDLLVGPGSGSQVGTLPNVNSNVFGSNSAVKITVNAKGQVLSAVLMTLADIKAIQGYTSYDSLNPKGYISLASLSATSPIFYNNSTGVISSQPGTTSQNGYITSTDWNTFNGKLNNALSSGNIFVGNASNIATGQTMTGDGGINNTGVFTIQPNAVTTGKIINSAVTYAKIQSATQQALLGAPAAGLYQEITLGTNLSITGGVLNASTAGAQTLTYTQNATNNNLAISGGNSQNFLAATSSLAGLLDTARAKYIDSARGRLINFNLYAANGLTAANLDSFYLGGSLNQNTTIGTAGFTFNMTGLPNKSTALSTDSLLIETLAGQFYKLPIVTGGITQLTGPVTAGPGSGSQATAISANAIGTAMIQANAVTLPKLSTGPSNQLIGYDGSGNPTAIAASTGITISGGLISSTGGGGGISQLFSKTASLPIFGTDTVGYALALNVKDFGAVGDGVHNDGPAMRAAIAADSARGGGHIYFPLGIYLDTDSLDPSCNCQLRIPSNNPITSSKYYSYIFDAEPGSTVPGGGYANTVSKLPTTGVIIHSGITSNATNATVFGTTNQAGLLFNFNNIGFNNITVQTYTNHGAQAQTLSAFGLWNASSVQLYYCNATTDTTNQIAKNPIGNEVCGFCISNTYCGGPSLLFGCQAMGYKYGYILGELTNPYNCYAIANNYGLVSTRISYPVAGTMILTANNWGIYCPPSSIMNGVYLSSNADLDLTISFEYDAKGFWYDSQGFVKDSLNLLTGQVKYLAGDSIGSFPNPPVIGATVLDLINLQGTIHQRGQYITNAGGLNSGLMISATDPNKYAIMSVANDLGKAGQIFIGGSTSTSGAAYQNNLTIALSSATSAIKFSTVDAPVCGTFFDNGHFLLGVNQNTDVSKSIFTVNSTTETSLPMPRMTTTQMNALTGIPEGSWLYNTSIGQHTPYYYNSANLVNIVPFGNAGDVVFQGINGGPVNIPTIHIDSTNGRLGIGTASPSTPLELKATVNGVEELRVTNLSTGTAGISMLHLNNSAHSVMEMGGLSSGYTTSGLLVANGTYLYNGFGPMVLATNSQVLSLSVDALSTPALQVATSKNVLIGGTTDNGSRFQVNGAVSFAYNAYTANHTATGADWFMDCTLNSFTITLPTAVGCSGRQYIVKNTSGGVITIATTSSQTIDGAAPGTVPVSTPLAIVSDGANWKSLVNSGSNFYTADGTLSGNRTVTQSGNSLTFTGGPVSMSGNSYNNSLGSSYLLNSSTIGNSVTAASGTVTDFANMSLNGGSLTATNTGVTYTNASTLYLVGAPSASTNVTITNPFALKVAGGAVTFNAAQFSIQGNSNWNPAGTITGSRISLNPGTLTDNVGTGTVTNAYVMGLTTPVLAASSSVTYTNAYSLYLNAAPSASTNVAITNSYALGVGGAALFQAQLSTGSIALNGWQTVTSGTTSTVNNTQTNWLLNPASLIAAFTVTLPSAPTDGQLVKLHFGGTVSGGSTVVTALTVSPNGGQSIEQSAAITTALGGNCYIYQYNAALSTWYREQ